MDGSAAARSGIEPGDVVRSLDGLAIGSMDDFDQWLDAQLSGRRVDVELIGKHAVITLDPPRDRFAGDV